MGRPAAEKLANIKDDLSARPFGSRYSRMDQVKFVETANEKLEVIWSA